MPQLGGLPIEERVKFSQCSVSGCDGTPYKRYRVVGALVVYMNLCRLHLGLTNFLSVAISCTEVSRDEWIVGEVMDS